MGEGAQDEEQGPRGACLPAGSTTPRTQNPVGLLFLQGPAGVGGRKEHAISAPHPARFSIPVPKPLEAVLPSPTTQGPSLLRPSDRSTGLGVLLGPNPGQFPRVTWTVQY